MDVLTHDPSGDVAAKSIVSDEVKADKDKLAQAFKLTANLTLTGEKNQNLDQDWGFGISADTAIMKRSPIRMRLLRSPSSSPRVSA